MRTRRRSGKIDADLSAAAQRLALRYDPDHLHLVPWDSETYWTRDFSPWWVKDISGERFGIAKHVYTTLGGGDVGIMEGADASDPHLGKGIFRPYDDYAAVALSDMLNQPVMAWNQASWPGGKTLRRLPTHVWYFTGLLDVGGNYMVTGQNRIASSYLVATQNELPGRGAEDRSSPGELDRRLTYILGQLNRFMGITSYHVLADPTGSYIGHIDCWGKFLADDTVMIARSQDAAIEAAFDRIAGVVRGGGGLACTGFCCPTWYVAGGFQPATNAAYTKQPDPERYRVCADGGNWLRGA